MSAVPTLAAPPVLREPRTRGARATNRRRERRTCALRRRNLRGADGSEGLILSTANVKRIRLHADQEGVLRPILRELDGAILFTSPIGGGRPSRSRSERDGRVGVALATAPTRSLRERPPPKGEVKCVLLPRARAFAEVFQE